MKNPIQMYGHTTTIVQRNNKKSKKEMEWTGDYDGNIANVHLHVNEDGKTKAMQMNLEKNDLINLLTVPTNNLALEKRLLHDFPFLHSTTPKKKKTRRKYRSSKKSRRSFH
jgi:hypothetical protein